MSEKSKANYYGGYTLHRSTNTARSAVTAQPSTTLMAAPAAQPQPSPAACVPPPSSVGLPMMNMMGFGSDWMMSAMMPMTMARAPPQPPVAAAAAALKAAPPAPTAAIPVLLPGGVSMAAAAPPAVPAPAPAFWNNFMVQSNFYRGPPMHHPAAATAPALSHHHVSPKVHVPVAPMVAATAAPRAAKPMAAAAAASVSVAPTIVPQFSGMWHAFDAPVAFTSKSAPSAHFDPVGTAQAKKTSLWSGTPVSSTRDDEAWYNPFSSLMTPQLFSKMAAAAATTTVSAAPVAAAAAVPLRMVSSIDASSSDDEGYATAPLTSTTATASKKQTQQKDFTSDDINSDDDDWLDHLRDTVTQVLRSVELDDEQQQHLNSEVSAGADDAVGVPNAFATSSSWKKGQQVFDPEWSKLRAA